MRRTIRAIRSHKKLAVLALGVVAIGALVGGVVSTTAFQDAYTSGVSPAPEVHKFRTVAGLTADEIQADFCAACHDVEVGAIASYNHASVAQSTCYFCHTPGTEGHAAKKTTCVNSVCHTSESVDLNLDTAAHKTILDDTGEAGTTEYSWACKACHTYHPVNIDPSTHDTTPPIELDIDAPVVPWV